MSELPAGFDPEFMVVTTAGQIAAYAAEAWENGYASGSEDTHWNERGAEFYREDNPYVLPETIEVAE